MQQSCLFLAVSGGTDTAVGGFIMMTAASTFLLWVLPAIWRHHVSKVGTYVHEVSHGVTSLLTGGDFHQFRVGDWGGVCVTSGGNRFAVAAAGYIGTIVLGAVFLARSAQADALVITLQILAIVVALSTLKAGDLQTATVGMIVAATLGLFGTLMPTALVTRFLLNLMGVILIWQGFKALKVLCIISLKERPTGSDAEAMAHLAGHSPLHWAVVLGGIALVAFLVIIGMAIQVGVAAT